QEIPVPEAEVNARNYRNIGEDRYESDQRRDEQVGCQGAKHGTGSVATAGRSGPAVLPSGALGCRFMHVVDAKPLCSFARRALERDAEKYVRFSAGIPL